MLSHDTHSVLTSLSCEFCDGSCLVSWLVLVMLARATFFLLVLLHILVQVQGQYELCKSLLTTDDGSVWEQHACQPKAQSMKEFMRIRVEPPDITCGNPPERFCTLVSTLNIIIFTEISRLSLICRILRCLFWFSVDEIKKIPNVTIFVK